GRQRRRAEPRPESSSRNSRHRLAFLVGLADVRDGEVRYFDRRREPTLELVARQVTASVSDVAADRPNRVSLRAALFGAETANLAVRGSVGPFDDPVLARTPLDLRWTLDETDGTALVRAAPAVGMRMPRELVVAGPLTAHGRMQGRLDRLAGDAAVDASA